jgi:hypothetical protein
MQVGLLYILMQVENLFNGRSLDRMLANCPLNSFAAVYKRVGNVLTTFLCFKWISMLVASLQFSKKGACKWMLRGALLPVLYLLYSVLSDIFESLLPESTYTQVNCNQRERFPHSSGYCCLLRPHGHDP